jgi:isopenicillin-N N-acyltransferase-like protein
VRVTLHFVTTRSVDNDTIPSLSIEGSSFACGEQLGEAWRDTLRTNADLAARGRWTPWWRKGDGGVVADLVEQIAPHLADLYRGMAKGAGIDECLCAPAPITAPILEDCTSFAVEASATAAGHAIVGQTKDTGADRIAIFQVLRLKPNDAPGMLTLTYPGELFGFGFASTGISIFRNALYVTNRDRSEDDNGIRSGQLPFDAFGLLALCSSRLDDAIDLAMRHGVQITGHVTVADAGGRAIGLEMCEGRTEMLEPRDGLYAHANHAVAPAMRALESDSDRAVHHASASKHRQSRLYDLICADRGRLTPQLMLAKLADHANYPVAICCHRGPDYQTTAAAVAEPSRGWLHVTRGAPCCHWASKFGL